MKQDKGLWIIDPNPKNAPTYKCTLNCINAYQNTPPPASCKKSGPLKDFCEPAAVGHIPVTTAAEGALIRRVILETNEAFLQRAKDSAVQSVTSALEDICEKMASDQLPPTNGPNPMYLCPDSYYGCDQGCYPGDPPASSLEDVTIASNSCTYEQTEIEPENWNNNPSDITGIRYKATCTGSCRFKQDCFPVTTPPPDPSASPSTALQSTPSSSTPPRSPSPSNTP